MNLQSGQVLELLDAEQRVLGRVTVENREGELIGGRFTPGPGFVAVERFFRDFEEAADAQALRALDRIDAAIAALGLHMRVPGEGQSISVRDVQIWGGGDMTCRLAGGVSDVLNGNAQGATPAEQVRKP